MPRTVHAVRPGHPLDEDARLSLRRCFARYVTGVAVVTFEGPSGRRGITVNSFTSVSLSPPLVLVSIDRTARAGEDLEGREFAVNVLGAEQRELAELFSGRSAFDPVWVADGPVPRLAGTLAWLDCRPWARYDGGDHILYLGEVTRYAHRDGDALGFVGGRLVPVPVPQAER